MSFLIETLYMIVIPAGYENELCLVSGEQKNLWDPVVEIIPETVM